MNSLGLFHLVTAIVALTAGAAVILSTKGTRRHRQMGWVFVASMMAMNGSALLIYRLFGRFGPFHVFALISLASVAAGTIAAIRARRARIERDLARRSRLVDQHYQLMNLVVRRTVRGSRVGDRDAGPGVSIRTRGWCGVRDCCWSCDDRGHGRRCALDLRPPIPSAGAVYSLT